MSLFAQFSDNVDIVLEKLMKAKQEIGTVKKDSKNPFHKSNYASLNAYIDASEQHLLNNGLILVQAGNGSFTEPVMVSTLIHPASGQWIKSYFPILNPKSDSQGLGASVTYMRRYSISTLLGLVSEDDDGETAVGRGKYDNQKKNKSPEVDTQPIENESEYIDKFLNLFDKEDKFHASEYLKVVQAHFEWTKVQTIKELLKDEKRLFEKFNSWKSKIKKPEEKNE
jgi:hypothetical protein